MKDSGTTKTCSLRNELNITWTRPVKLKMPAMSETPPRSSPGVSVGSATPAPSSTLK